MNACMHDSTHSVQYFKRIWEGDKQIGGQVTSGQVRSGPVRSGQVRSGQVISGQIGSDRVRFSPAIGTM